MKPLLSTLAAVFLAANPAVGAGLLGTWETQPDARAQTGHVAIRPCGSTLCGTVTSAFDSKGRPITTPSVGRRILWDVGASTGRGRVYVPIMNRDFPVWLNASGDTLHLKACNDIGLCQTQRWRRVN